MANLKIDRIEGDDGNNGPIFEGNLVFSSTAHLVLPKGTTAERPVGVSTGAMRYNTESSNVEYYNGTSWVEVSSYDAGVRGVFGGGYSPTLTNTIDYISIQGLGNATDFGDLTVARFWLSACSSSTRGVFGGGYVVPTIQNVLDYITIATTGNATDFGDLTVARFRPAACSSSTRGVFGGGGTPTLQNVIDYITIASVGNATDFGDLTVARAGAASCSSSTRGVFGGGNAGPTTYNTIDYITIATTGNATDFGDLTIARNSLASCSSSTRGVFGGGLSPTPATTIFNTIDYITIASVGNATDFGDLTVSRYDVAACSSSTRGVFGGGATPTPASTTFNTIDYITIVSVGNATDFGDLTTVRTQLAACSNAHGGLS
jgi:hypothetical protein